MGEETNRTLVVFGSLQYSLFYKSDEGDKQEGSKAGKSPGDGLRCLLQGRKEASTSS